MQRRLQLSVLIGGCLRGFRICLSAAVLSVLILAAQAADVRTPAAVGLIPFPSNASALVSNLLYITEHDLSLRDDFYTDESLRRLMGARHITGDRSQVDVSVLVSDLRSMHKPVAQGDHSLPGGSLLLRRGSKGNSSILLQVNDPMVRPRYEIVDRIFEGRWLSVPPPGIPSPHSHQIYPTGPHGLAHMVLQTRTSLANTTIDADFDPDGKLHHMLISVEPISGRK
jgi:hypothetical protein